MNICKEDYCHDEVSTRGLCRHHYYKWTKSNGAPCSVDGCDRPSYVKGLCESHYHKSRRTAQKQTCTIDGCDRPVYARMLCQSHYQYRGTDRANKVLNDYSQRVNDAGQIVADADETKTCTLCDQTKPLNEFFFDRGARRGKCKACSGAINRLYAWKSGKRKYFPMQDADYLMEMGLDINDYI